MNWQSWILRAMVKMLSIYFNGCGGKGFTRVRCSRSPDTPPIASRSFCADCGTPIALQYAADPNEGAFYAVLAIGPRQRPHIQLSRRKQTGVGAVRRRISRPSS